MGYTIKSIRYTQDVEIDVLVPVKDVEMFIESVNDAANGNVLADTGEKEYVII